MPKIKVTAVRDLANEVSADSIAWISGADMVEVDRVMMEDLRIDLIQMMENAGRALARVVEAYAEGRKITVAAGTRGNGGGGLVAARHLANKGFDVSVAVTAVERMTPVPAHQLDILSRMGIPIVDDVRDAQVYVDAVIGYSLRGAPRGRSEQFINSSRSAETVISLDTPSGLNIDTGETPGAFVSADATVTLALPKVGMRTASQVGDLYLADISVPPAVTAQFGSPAPNFDASGLVLVNRSKV